MSDEYPPVYDIATGRIKLRDSSLSRTKVFIVENKNGLRFHPIEHGTSGPGLPFESIVLTELPYPVPVRNITEDLKHIQELSASHGQETET